MVECCTSTSVRDIRPPITNFGPSMWGDIFSSFFYDDQVQAKYSEEMEALKKEARSMLMAATSTKLLVLVDKLERLGLAYHFETEIENKLKQVYDSVEKEHDHYDLFSTALRFRLLRQHQYHVSCNGFNKFVDKDNKLKQSLCGDIEGLLSLYEASHVRIYDENILEEAVVFTTHHLSNVLPELESPIKEKVQQALDYPLHKSVAILNLRFYISIFEKEVDSRDELLLRLAKLNFNFLTNIYRNELFQLSTWWNKFDLKSKLPYIRDRLVECYLWGIAYHYEPQYSYVRMVIGQTYQMLELVDDTYDNYATLEEIDLLNQAFARWNTGEIDELPDYMQIVYKFVMSVSQDFEREAEKQGKSFAIPYYIEAIKQVGRAYGKEQKWIMEGEMPPYEEYMANSIITALMYVTFTAIVPGIKSATKETINWLLSHPKLVVSTAVLGRHLDDLASHQRESREGKLVTIMECYMKDKGVSKQETLCAFAEIIEDRWKHVNAEWVKTTMVPKEMAVQFLNILRMAEVTYKNSHDGGTYPQKNLAPLITALLVDHPFLI
ncbi:hypothetical protein C2S51_001784 [Perilla frutescens var. frutescens]|nr:hypothetical protein C2S51_001784 [Perilla frutescens var. frutescens]